MEKGRFGGYLAYAAGEIILVVVGIIIALQINNWNDNRKQEEKVAGILKEVQNDLFEDIRKSNDIFNEYQYRDSLKWNVVNDRYTYENYASGNVYPIIYQYIDLVLHMNGYNSLMRNLDNIPDKYASVLEDLNEIYVTDKSFIDVFNERMHNTVYENIDYLANNKDWYVEFTQGRRTDAMIEYYLHDPYYRNRVMHFCNDFRNLFQETTNFRVDAINACRTIAELIGNEDNLPDFVSYNDPDTARLQSYTGSYSLTEGDNREFGDEMKISQEDGRFFGTYPEMDISYDLYYIKPGTFHLKGSQTIIRFATDDEGRLTLIKTNGYGETRWGKEG